MGIIGTIIVGLIAGLLARMIKPGNDAMGWIMTIVLGIAGAFVGDFIADLLNIGVDGGFTSLIFSVIGAIMLLFIYELLTGKRNVS